MIGHEKAPPKRGSRASALNSLGVGHAVGQRRLLLATADLVARSAGAIGPHWRFLEAAQVPFHL